MGESKWSNSSALDLLMKGWGTARDSYKANKSGKASDVHTAGLSGLGTLGSALAWGRKATKGKTSGFHGLGASGINLLTNGASVYDTLKNGKLSKDDQEENLSGFAKYENIAFQGASTLNNAVQSVQKGKTLFGKSTQEKEISKLDRTESGLGMFGSLLGAVSSGAGLVGNFLGGDSKKTAQKVQKIAKFASGIANIGSSIFGIINNGKKIWDAYKGNTDQENNEAGNDASGHESNDPPGGESEAAAGSEPEAAVESESDNALGSESGSVAGSESDNALGSESGSVAGSESDNESGSELEIGFDSESGSVAGSESDNESGSELESGSDSESGSVAGSESDNALGSEPDDTSTDMQNGKLLEEAG